MSIRPAVISPRSVRDRSLTGATALALAGLVACGAPPEPEARWWRGNLHTHSLWSDGNEFPEVLLAAYRDSGYHFVAVSDHNTVTDGERWIPVGDDSASALRLERYRERFGADWVEVRPGESGDEVRLKRFDEYAARVGTAGRFLVIKAEEITDQYERKPLHVNATNLARVIEPRGGASVREVLQNNIDAVVAQREETGQRMMPHVNHPNYGWAVTVEDLMHLDGEKFFEVYNGHPAVHNRGDSARPGTERMWDIILAHRLTSDQPVMYGIAVDDAHHYQRIAPDRVNPFRGWVMVRTPVLEPEAIVAALEAGDFYGSTGISLRTIEVTDSALALEIDGEPGVTYVTEFIGTRRDFDRSSSPRPPVDGATVSRRYSDEIGVTLAIVDGLRPRYAFAGDELYVRARIRSSRPTFHARYPDEREQAWVQPLVVHRP